jgi:hypothetical protein
LCITRRLIELTTSAAASCSAACSSIDNNLNLQGFLPGSWKTRKFDMTYTVGYNQNSGATVNRGPDNYGLNGGTLYTGSGPLWRTKITNWEGVGNNTDINPNPQPNPDPCKANPVTNDICF